ncbi:MAG: ribonuclease H-like domain-containing protein [Saprospiraceae bacterium]
MNPKQLFLDIETASQVNGFQNLDPEWQELWSLKSRYFLEKEPSKPVEEVYTEKAAIYAEFGQIICISVGILDDGNFRVKSFLGDELTILTDFFALISKSYNDARFSIFIGHNVKEFDIPYICRRAIINGVSIPPSLELYGKKPWEVSHIHDTLEMWKFGDFKHFISLDLLAKCLHLPSSKQDIRGSDVGRVFWVDQDIQRISRYCQQDVLLTARVYRKLKGDNEIKDDQVVWL